MRKTILLLPWILIAGIATLQLFWLMTDPPTMTTKCPFCATGNIDRQRFHRGTLAQAMVNYKPLLKGHSMVIPVRHVERMEDLTPDELAEIGQVINRVQKAFQQVYGTSDYLLVVQNGVIAGQTVNHVHFHMVPRVEKNVILKTGLWWMMLTRAFQSWLPVDWREIEGERDRLRDAMQQVGYRTSLTQRNPVPSFACA